MPDSGHVSARAANGGDLHRIGELFAQSVEEMASQRGGKQLVADLSDEAGVSLLVHAGRWKIVTEALSRPTPTMWVGECEGKIAGFAWGRVDQHSEFGPLLGVVDFVYVEPPSRSKGIAEAIMSEVRAWFEGQGCAAMDANALPGDRLTKNFFEESGFKARLLVMHRPIGAAAAHVAATAAAKSTG